MAAASLVWASAGLICASALLPWYRIAGVPNEFRQPGSGLFIAEVGRGPTLLWWRGDHPPDAILAAAVILALALAEAATRPRLRMWACVAALPAALVIGALVGFGNPMPWPWTASQGIHLAPATAYWTADAAFVTAAAATLIAVGARHNRRTLLGAPAPPGTAA